jgi:hypothetical protein
MSDSLRYFEINDIEDDPDPRDDLATVRPVSLTLTYNTNHLVANMVADISRVAYASHQTQKI